MKGGYSAISNILDLSGGILGFVCMGKNIATTVAANKCGTIGNVNCTQKEMLENKLNELNETIIEFGNLELETRNYFTSLTHLFYETKQNNE